MRRFACSVVLVAVSSHFSVAQETTSRPWSVLGDLIGSRGAKSAGRMVSSRGPDPVVDEAIPQPPGTSVLRRAASDQRSAPAPSQGTTSAPGQPSAEELRINQQIRSVEQMLATEEKRLQSQMARLGEMRQVALKKEDAASLKRVEQMERQLVESYEARVNRIVAAFPNGSNGTGSRGATASRPTVAKQQSSAGRHAMTPQQIARQQQLQRQRAAYQQQQQRASSRSASSRKTRFRLPFGL